MIVCKTLDQYLLLVDVELLSYMDRSLQIPPYGDIHVVLGSPDRLKSRL